MWGKAQILISIFWNLTNRIWRKFIMAIYIIVAIVIIGLIFWFATRKKGNSQDGSEGQGPSIQ